MKCGAYGNINFRYTVGGVKSARSVNPAGLGQVYPQVIGNLISTREGCYYIRIHTA